eukprot:gnl/MRDRNA2_/MRDRNA2_31149_c0_seq1.p1 gnl/MRDRNA2_/MRDRNA2_31149_c0~~gnl/MRDRNA2_/MRDRNA2_31149_c0_seq1.p1  ORF type:complete len:349 (-),score=69.76 gnl/MRDRNA2_/MRDRNA2_31149_c0_seq1:77-1123(-)
MVDYSKFDNIQSSDEELESARKKFPAISTCLSGTDDSCASSALRSWQEARTNPSSPEEQRFFQLQDELHMKLNAIGCLGQMRGEKGLNARMQRAKQLIEDTLSTEALRTYAAKWNNPFGKPDADPLDQCTWSMSAMMRTEELSKHSRFSDILEDQVQTEKRISDEENHIFERTIQEGAFAQPKSINVEAARVCSNCGKDAAEKMCSACSVACYCSEECQKLHWKSHKKICAKLRNAEEELHGLKDMDSFFRSPIISLNDKRRGFVCWKQVRTSIECRGKKLKIHNSNVTIGRYTYMYTMKYGGEIRWKKGSKTKGVQVMRLQVPYQEFKEAGFNPEAPWLSDVDACRC